MSQLPVIHHGGGLDRRTERRVNRDLDRYEAAAFVAGRKEAIDQEILAECVLSAIGHAGQLVDVARAIAKDDPVKGKLFGELLQADVDITIARLTLRFGGAS